MKRLLLFVSLVLAWCLHAQPTAVTLTFKTVADMQAHVITASQTNVIANLIDTNRGGLFATTTDAHVVDGGRVFTNTGMGRVWVRVQNSGALNVRHYGAVGDGTTDDTAAIQAAVNAITNALYAKSVYFPSGNYKITGTITWPDVNTAVLRGDGPYTTRIFTTATTPMFAFVDEVPYGTVVDSLRLVGAGWDAGTTNSTGMYFPYQLNHASFNNARFEYFDGCGVYLGSVSGQKKTWNVHVENVTFVACRMGGIASDDGALNQLVVKSCEFNNLYSEGGAYASTNSIGLNVPGVANLLSHGSIYENCYYGILINSSNTLYNISINDSYFEKNQGQHVRIQTNGLAAATQSIQGFNFLRNYGISQNIATGGTLSKGILLTGYRLDGGRYENNVWASSKPTNTVDISGCTTGAGNGSWNVSLVLNEYGNDWLVPSNWKPNLFTGYATSGASIWTVGIGNAGNGIAGQRMVVDSGLVVKTGTRPSLTNDNASLYTADYTTGNATLYAQQENGVAAAVALRQWGTATTPRTSIGTSLFIDGAGDKGNFRIVWITNNTTWSTNSYAKAYLIAPGSGTCQLQNLDTSLSGPTRVVTITTMTTGTPAITGDGAVTLTVGGNLAKTWSAGTLPAASESFNVMVSGSSSVATFAASVTASGSVDVTFTNINVAVLAEGDLLHRHSYAAKTLVSSSSVGPYIEFSACGTNAANANVKNKVVALMSTTVTATPFVVFTCPTLDNGGDWTLRGRIYALTGTTGSGQIWYADTYTNYVDTITSTSLTGWDWSNDGYLFIGANADTADADVGITASSLEAKP